MTVVPTEEPSVETARAAGLRYVSDRDAGIRRQRRGEQFRYVGTCNHAVRERAVLARIRALAISPAYEEVWIRVQPRGICRQPASMREAASSMAITLSGARRATAPSSNA